MAGDVLLDYVDEHIQTFICPAESLIGLVESLFRRRLTLDKSPGDLDQAANRFVVRFECLVNSFDGLVNPLDAFRKLRLMLENELHSFSISCGAFLRDHLGPAVRNSWRSCSTEQP
jgi:hypothetical protein